MDSSLENKILEWSSLDISHSLKEEISQLVVHDHTIELIDRLCKSIQFGTAGLRGKMEAGFNRINEYTIKKASLGVARFLQSQGSNRKVVIAFDTRNCSEYFSIKTQNIFLNEGFKVIRFHSPTPTPLLSFAVKYFNASAGIMITASHNPKIYNGYKVFGAQGSQILQKEAQSISQEMEKIGSIPQYSPHESTCDEPGGDFYWFYYESILKLIKPPVKQSNLNVLYTPLFGTGRDFVKELLQNQLHIDIDVLEEQSDFNGDFPSLEVPNPELLSVYEKSLEYAQNKHYDLIMATDPDSDRIGILVFHQDQFEMLGGNEIGMIMSYYLLSNHPSPNGYYIAGSIVSTDIIGSMAKDSNAHYLRTLTGFKYIADLIQQDPVHYLFGFEESHGYLIGNYIQDKDAVSALGLVAQIAGGLKAKQKTLVDYLEEIYMKYGFYKNRVLSFHFSIDQYDRIKHIMEYFYNVQEVMFVEDRFTHSINVRRKMDFKNQTTQNFGKIPKKKALKGYDTSNLIIFYVEPYFKIAIRPSGTEPSIKIYLEIQTNELNYIDNKKNLIFQLHEFENRIRKNLEEI